MLLTLTSRGKRKSASLTVPSWNQLLAWLRDGHAQTGRGGVMIRDPPLSALDQAALALSTADRDWNHREISAYGVAQCVDGHGSKTAQFVKGPGPAPRWPEID